MFADLEKFNTCMSVADPGQDDCPLLYVNRRFTQVTGYTFDETVGRNCRFLQGRATNKTAVARLSAAIKRQVSIDICLLNYRCDGTPFHNFLVLSPIESGSGRRLILGAQFELKPDVFGMEDHLEQVHGAISLLSANMQNKPWQDTVFAMKSRADAARMLIETYFAAGKFG